MVRRRLSTDYREHYNVTVLPVETFVETPRHSGAAYRAAVRTHVGTTRAPGSYDRKSQFDKPEGTTGSGLSDGIGNEPSPLEAFR